MATIDAAPPTSESDLDVKEIDIDSFNSNDRRRRTRLRLFRGAASGSKSYGGAGSSQVKSKSERDFSSLHRRASSSSPRNPKSPASTRTPKRANRPSHSAATKRLKRGSERHESEETSSLVHASLATLSTRLEGEAEEIRLVAETFIRSSWSSPRIIKSLEDEPADSPKIFTFPIVKESTDCMKEILTQVDGGRKSSRNSQRKTKRTNGANFQKGKSAQEVFPNSMNGSDVGHKTMKEKRTKDARAKEAKSVNKMAKMVEVKDGETEDEPGYFFIPDDVIPEEEARKSWPFRYSETSVLEDEKGLDQPFSRHFMKVTVDDFIVTIGQNVSIQAEEGIYVGTVLELFETVAGQGFYRVRWFYKENDTVIANSSKWASMVPKGASSVPKEREGEEEGEEDEGAAVAGEGGGEGEGGEGEEGEPETLNSKKIWWSKLEGTQPISTITGVLKVIRVPVPPGLEATEIPDCDFYYHHAYSEENASFFDIPADADAPFPNEMENRIGKLPHMLPKNVSLERASTKGTNEIVVVRVKENGTYDVNLPEQKGEALLLDLYSGCGGMSTGLEMGASLAGLTLTTRWAVDSNLAACKSFMQNHPHTEVRNGNAEDFLELCKEWKRLCDRFPEESNADRGMQKKGGEGEGEGEGEGKGKGEGMRKNSGRKRKQENLSGARNAKGQPKEENDYEVEEIVGINYCKSRLQFRVRWAGYGEDEDTWEPESNLEQCQDLLKAFVQKSRRDKLLPLPGEVGVICGGPPCQGVSGHNLYRDTVNPFTDEKNRQLLVFMNIVKFLRPRYVLMENVSDLMKVGGGVLAKIAIKFLVDMNYQSRTGLLVAGSFGVAQFRLRAFFFGARSGESLPQFPLPTHLCTEMKNSIPRIFKDTLVAWKEEPGLAKRLEKGLMLRDVLEDLPPVENDEARDSMSYLRPPTKEFEHRVRLPRKAFGGENGGKKKTFQPTKNLYDHRPLRLNRDDYERTCLIPSRKAANFRDLEGVITNNNVCSLDESIPRPLTTSGKPLCPDYAIKFRQGRSAKPFARLWWDEIVPTVMTRAEPHNLQTLHPVQNRVLSVREYARLQGFPDDFKFYGDVKARYVQVGNAVSGPTAQALGFTLGRAALGFSKSSDNPIIELPKKFPFTAF